MGSKSISLRAAYALATVLESAGAILLGYKVLETQRFSVIDLPAFQSDELLLGQVAILGASALWMLIATLGKLPVSSTHAHVGSIIGFALTMQGTKGLHMGWVVKILVSWVISPVS